MLSIVIPIYNEEGLIDDLLGRTVAALNAFISDYEIIVVDDGSEDRSLPNLLKWQDNNSNIKVLSLSKNFGHQAAFTAGLEHASGEIVGMMDAIYRTRRNYSRKCTAKSQKKITILSAEHEPVEKGKAAVISIHFFSTFCSGTFRNPKH